MDELLDIADILKMLVDFKKNKEKRFEELTEKLSHLPKGNLYIYKSHHQKYYYHSYNDETGKKVNKYIDNTKSDESSLITELKLKKRIVPELRQLKTDLLLLGKMLKPAEKYLQKSVKTALIDIANDNNVSNAPQLPKEL